MTRERQVRIGDEVVRYSLKSSKRRKKTVGIRVSRSIVEVTAPTRTLIRDIEGILRKRGDWILEKMEAASQLPPPCQLTTGEALPLMGKFLPLLVEESNVKRTAVTSDGEGITVLLPPGLPGEDRRREVEAAIVRWYRGQLEGYLRRRVARWLPAMDRTEVPKILVRDQRSRWGSCSSDGTLRFSWRLAMLEPDLIDSVIVHELAHLDVMDHSPAFWRVVLKAMPDAKERRKRLNEAGRLLPL